jgi:hypothetical protein
MISDAEIKEKGVEALIGALGVEETRRFLTLADRLPADYTKWRHLLFDGMSLEEINDEAKESWSRSDDTFLKP